MALGCIPSKAQEDLQFGNIFPNCKKHIRRNKNFKKCKPYAYGGGKPHSRFFPVLDLKHCHVCTAYQPFGVRTLSGGALYQCWSLPKMGLAKQEWHAQFLNDFLGNDAHIFNIADGRQQGSKFIATMSRQGVACAQAAPTRVASFRSN